MLERVQAAPPDPILGLSAAFAADDRPHKINLGVGEYRDASGVTPVLDVVREAEARIVAAGGPKTYLPIDGSPEYGSHVQRLLFGDAAPGHAVTVQSPGGTGALRIAADFIGRHMQGASLWLSEPTWANHPKIFEAAGVPVKAYRYFDAAARGLDRAGLLEDLAGVGAGDVVLLHACCHNPSGVDLDDGAWREVAGVLSERGALPLIDFAYQGFGEGLEDDALGLRIIAGELDEFLVASSFSKNFGLYQDRVGALTVVTKDAQTAQRVLSQLKICVRTSFSNPPAHGSAIVSTILGDDALTHRWHDELALMRERINGMRQALTEGLAHHGAATDYVFVTRQRGMFSFSGLSADQVETLREEHAVYIVGSGRINVAGVTPDRLDDVCRAIVAVGG